MGDLSKSKNMKALLVIALATVATAKPWVYTTGLHHPYLAPVVYAAPPVVHVPVTNTCHNEAGALVPCAQPAGVVGESVYAYPDAVHPGFVQHGALATVAAPAPVAEAAAAEEAVVAVEKRDAEADPEADADADAKSWWYGYYGHPYGGYYGHHGYYGGYHGLYGHGWYGHGYGYHGVGCRNGYGALVPCAHG